MMQQILKGMSTTLGRPGYDSGRLWRGVRIDSGYHDTGAEAAG